MSQADRVLGREGDVRVDAQISSTPTGSLFITYEIENQRSAPIALAGDFIETSFDPASATIVIRIGSEIPGTETLPRLVKLEPGQRKGFTAGAALLSTTETAGRMPRAVRIVVNYLSDPEPFEMLVGTPEKLVRNRQLADQLFTDWIDHNEVVSTNSVPLRVSASHGGGVTAAVAHAPRSRF